MYAHFNGHIPNLCSIDLSEVVVLIRSNFGIIKSVCNLNEVSCKTHKIFEDIQKQATSIPFSLKKLCDIRWPCRFESLKVVLTCYGAMLTTLQGIEVT